MNNKKKIIVHMMGGLGNQLFSYYCGVLLSRKNNADIYQETIVTRFFEIKHYRKPELHKFKNLTKNANIVSSIYIFTYRILNKIFKYPNILSIKIFNHKFSFFNDIKNNFPLSYFNNYRMEKNETVYLIGYWQKIDFFLHNNLPLLKINTADLNKKILRLKNKKTIAIHLRGNERHKDQKKYFRIPSINFYKRSIEYFNEKNHGYNLHVFTDDLNYAEYIFSKLKIKKKIIYVCNYAKNHIVEIFLLTLYSNYIIANSTFSLFPALINKNKNKKIIVFDAWGKKKYPKSLLSKYIKVI